MCALEALIAMPVLVAAQIVEVIAHVRLGFKNDGLMESSCEYDLLGAAGFFGRGVSVFWGK